MKKNIHAWLILELGDPLTNQRLRSPLFCAIELSAQFVRRVHRLARLARRHHIDSLCTRSLETKVFWDGVAEDEPHRSAVTHMEFSDDVLFFRLEQVRPHEVIGTVNEQVGVTFGVTLEELDAYLEEADQLHFVEIFDWDEPAVDAFIPQVLLRMKVLGHWPLHEAEITRLLSAHADVNFPRP